MNRIFRVVFNQATGMMAVASELAKTGRSACMKTVAVTIVAGASMLTGLPVQAEDLYVSDGTQHMVTKDQSYNNAKTNDGAVVVTGGKLTVTGNVDLTNQTVDVKLTSLEGGLPHSTSYGQDTVMVKGAEADIGSTESESNVVLNGVFTDSEESATSVAALRVESGGQVTVNGRSVTMQAQGLQAAGIYSSGKDNENNGSRVAVTSSDTLNVSATTVAGTETQQLGTAAGVYAGLGGSVTLDAYCLNISAISNSSQTSDAIQVNGGTVQTISPTDSNIRKLSVTATGNGTVHGARVTNNGSNSASLTLWTAEDMEINGTSSAGSAYGVQVDSGTVNLNGYQLKLTATAQNSGLAEGETRGSASAISNAGETTLTSDNIIYITAQSNGGQATAIDNSGTLIIDGRLHTCNGGDESEGTGLSNSGTVTLKKDATFDATTTGVNNTGTLNIEGGKTIVDKGMTGSGTVNVGVTGNGDLTTATLCAAANQAGTININSGSTWEVTGNSTLGSLSVAGGTVSGSGYDLTVDTLATTGSATLTVKDLTANATATDDGNATAFDNRAYSLALDASSLNLKATAENGTATALANSTTLTINSTLDATGTTSENGTGTSYGIDNSGTLTLSKTANISGATAGVRNTGTLIIASETTTVTNGISGGEVQVGTVAEDNTTTATLTSSATDVSSLTVNAGSTWNVSGNSTVDALTVTGATVTGEGAALSLSTLDVSGTSTLTTGTLSLATTSANALTGLTANQGDAITVTTKGVPEAGAALSISATSTEGNSTGVSVAAGGQVTLAAENGATLSVGATAGGGKDAVAVDNEGGEIVLRASAISLEAKTDSGFAYALLNRGTTTIDGVLTASAVATEEGKSIGISNYGSTLTLNNNATISGGTTGVANVNGTFYVAGGTTSVSNGINAGTVIVGTGTGQDATQAILESCADDVRALTVNAGSTWTVTGASIVNNLSVAGGTIEAQEQDVIFDTIAITQDATLKMKTFDLTRRADGEVSALNISDGGTVYISAAAQTEKNDALWLSATSIEGSSTGVAVSESSTLTLAGSGIAISATAAESAVAIDNAGTLTIDGPLSAVAVSTGGEATGVLNRGVLTIKNTAAINGAGIGIENTGTLHIDAGTTTVAGGISGTGVITVGTGPTGTGATLEATVDGATRLEVVADGTWNLAGDSTVGTLSGEGTVAVGSTGEGKAMTLAAATSGLGHLTLAGGSIWQVTGDSSLGTLETSAATLEAGSSSIGMAAFENTGDTVITTARADAGQITVDTLNNRGSLTVALGADLADVVAGNAAAEKAQSAANILKVGAITSDAGYGVSIAEGKVAGAIVADVDNTGRLVAASVREKDNSAMRTMRRVASNNALVFRSQMNDLDKRMGDLRTMPDGDGAWARVIAGQSEYRNAHNTYQTLQVGADRRFGSFFAGAMGSYTDGDGSLSNGSTDDKNYSFGLYGGWLGDDGQFVDVTVKRHRQETDYEAYYASGEKIDGSMDTSGTSVSLEYGRRFGITDTNYYVEPQVEFMYGHLNSTGYTTSNGVRMSQDAVKTAVGRLGVAAGWVDPAKRGSAYIKASVLNDWAGNARMTASYGQTSRRYHEDTGGTWGEFAVGGTVNITKNVSAYGEMETTAGNPVRTTYQVTGGVRVSF